MKLPLDRHARIIPAFFRDNENVTIDAKRHSLRIENSHGKIEAAVFSF